MNARENLAELSDFLAGDLTLELAAVARPRESQGAPEYRSIALARQAEQFFRDVVNDCVGRHLSPLSWSVREIDPTYKPDQTDVEWQRLVDLLPVSSTITRLSNLSSTEPFRSKDDDYKSRLSYWAAVMSDADGRQAFFFRAFSAKAELKRKRGAALVARDGAFGLVEDSIFVFDDVVDCFVFGEFVYVLRRRDFRRIFDQMEKVLRRAKAVAGELHARVPIDNFEAFEQACATDSRLADKIVAISKRDYFDKLNYEMLSPVIEEFGLEIPTVASDGETRLVFRPAPSDRFRILKLIDDDYLRSAMTEHRYEVNSKTEPPAS